jgi:hypothetical protein
MKAKHPLRKNIGAPFELNDSIIFKLTDDTIKDLVDHYESTWYATGWSIDETDDKTEELTDESEAEKIERVEQKRLEKERQKEERQKKEFMENDNSFVFPTTTNSVSNINDGGSGKLPPKRLQRGKECCAATFYTSAITKTAGSITKPLRLAPKLGGCLASDSVSSDSMPILQLHEPQAISTPPMPEYMVDVSLFSTYFSSRKPVCNENYSGVGHAVDRFVDAIDRRFSCSPWLNRDCGSLFEVRRAKRRVHEERIWLRALRATLT